MNKSVKFLSLNICYVLLWIKYWLMWFESLLVFILFKFKKRPNISGIRVVLPDVNYGNSLDDSYCIEMQKAALLMYSIYPFQNYKFTHYCMSDIDWKDWIWFTVTLLLVVWPKKKQKNTHTHTHTHTLQRQCEIEKKNKYGWKKLESPLS